MKLKLNSNHFGVEKKDVIKFLDNELAGVTITDGFISVSDYPDFANAYLLTLNN